jgi:hypothetical protein
MTFRFLPPGVVQRGRFVRDRSLTQMSVGLLSTRQNIDR